MSKDQDHPIFEYSEITSQIYIGANACCKVHLKDELFHKGIDAEINLEEAETETPIGIEAYLWLPTKDDFAPNFAQMEIGARALKLIKEKRPEIHLTEYQLRALEEWKEWIVNTRTHQVQSSK